MLSFVNRSILFSNGIQQCNGNAMFDQHLGLSHSR